MNYAFTFDASACTGCKACQVACKDKNNLPTGVLWRRVYEVTGGTWQHQNDAWTTNVFAYNLSIACNHCVHPKCAGVCPTDAYVVRDDGIVYIDETKCMGCGYCSWACPYAAPQYNPDLRHMTKCNFCFDNIDAGLPPACVAACPLRVLDCVSLTPSPLPLGEGQGVRALWEIPASAHPFPLPDNSRTEPHLAIKPHAGMLNGLDKTVSNQEEVKPRRHNNLDELPLVIFTLLGQMSAGMALFSLLVHPSTLLLLAIGILLAIGGLASFLHLGTKKNAWRAILHLRKSWLSREMLVSGLFAASWSLSLAEHWILNTDHWLPVTAVLGLGLVYSMMRVYYLRAVPAWNTWRTGAAFLMSAGLLGLTGVGLFTGGTWIWILLVLLLAAQLALVVLAAKNVHETANRIRVALVLTGMAGVGVKFLSPGEIGTWISILIFLSLLAEEFVGRWQFYASRSPRM